ncbi:SbcC/MukB-like Walker B domain-containing protein [Rhodanobacter sp. DHB23]|uniref:SbcC/MukB-like Walker B domain-containing protein n=1 Tax=Rhodanobacter sp. DHB23 TaxID=2775923 RepID=UPI00177CA21D|nr:SbcC/MukB-like Walker B domain-containing protein [Rhodanobacter sp. DHB23]MBD8872821.1 AAA family ATPase [Rhodanobacter sp. DHB23]
MQLLERVHLVQFFLFEAQTLELDATSAIIAPNGAGKSALLDALQVVLLGGDRSRIRFNAQAGGSARARSIRDYCLGVYRSGEEGRKRRTATTYITLVFRDQDSGVQLSAGIALGASADEPEHRVYGQYIVPGVALELADHLEANGRLPLEWATFKELAVRRCREAGGKPELHSSSERFVKDLLFRLRAAPGAHPDVNAYRKAFQNALNLQRVEDVDLFVRTLVAEDRPTDIARFRALLETFRQLKEKIAQVVARIAAAETVDAQYERIAQQATRAASHRALGAEYARDLLAEQVEQAELACEAAADKLAATRRALEEAGYEQQAAEDAHAQANARLQGSQGYGEQAQIDELAGRDRAELARLKKELTRDVAFVREQWQALGKLGLPAVDVHALAGAQARWDAWYDVLAELSDEAALPWPAETVHGEARQALAAARPLIDALDGHARALHARFDEAQGKLAAARQNQKRLAAGQAELNADVVRLMGYLRDEGIDAKPVCDLVRVDDAAWQPVIEAYLRSNVEALLIPAADEERAVKLYRALAGGRSVYGVKLALSSHARQGGGDAKPGSVAALLGGDNTDALAFLRRQLGELRCVDSEAELVASRQGLTRDGLLAKGGSIERLRLPATGELKIGATDNRARLRVLREEIDAAEHAVRELEPGLRRAEACQRGLARLADPDEAAQALRDRVLEHRQVEQRYRAALESRDAAADPDLLRLAEQVRELHDRLVACRTLRDGLLGKVAVDESNEKNAQRLLEGLQAQEDLVARRAVEAFRHPDVDPNRVERLREELDAKCPALEERSRRCEERAQDSDKQLGNLLPEAWSQLAQYAKDHALALEFDTVDWRAARTLLAKELAHLRDSELANYQGEADRAYATATETFRSNVASTLHDNFDRLRTQINTLNRTLRASPAFSNNERYQFHHEVAPEYRELYRFIQRVVEVGGEDNLFDSAGEVPAAFRELIEDNAAQRGAASPLDDYRRFFRFEVQIRHDDKVIGSLSERMRSGSGGEHRAPLYVIAGAALAAAYGKSEAHPGGIGLILLDEFGDKIDAQNARATVDYLRSLGLQLVLAAPDTAQGTLSGVLDSYIELFRDGDLLQALRMEVQPAARELLLSDQFDLHPELLAEETARIAGEQATT